MTRRFTWHTTAALAALLTIGSSAAADTPPKREVPNYDGRGPAKEPGEGALWVPRIIVSPLYLVSEYVIRLPLGTLISSAERAHVPKALYDFFAFGPNHKAGFAPIAFWDFGFNPAFGVYVFWDDALFKRNSLRIHGSTFGQDWLAGSIVDRIHFNKNDWVAFEVTGYRRPDFAFFGIGPNTTQSQRSRYGQDLVDGGWLIDLHPWRASRVAAGMGIRHVRTYHGHFYRDKSVEVKAARGVFPLPFGFGDDYTAEYNRALLALDSRVPTDVHRPPPNGSGVRLQAEGEQATEFDNSPMSSWIRYGFSASGYLDLTGHQRVLGLTAATQFVDPIGNHPIPFNELMSLGPVSFSDMVYYSNYQLMPGFLPGRMRGRSGAALILHYSWPVWSWMDGVLQAAVGNVFGPHLEDFKPSLLRASGAIGFSSGQYPDGSLDLLFGVGTETFDHGAQMNSFRLSVGINRAF
jgi:hypothetical protein